MVAVQADISNINGDDVDWIGVMGCINPTLVNRSLSPINPPACSMWEGQAEGEAQIRKSWVVL